MFAERFVCGALQRESSCLLSDTIAYAECSDYHLTIALADNGDGGGHSRSSSVAKGSELCHQPVTRCTGDDLFPGAAIARRLVSRGLGISIPLSSRDAKASVARAPIATAIQTRHFPSTVEHV